MTRRTVRTSLFHVVDTDKARCTMEIPEELRAPEIWDLETLPECWRACLLADSIRPALKSLRRFLQTERGVSEVFPGSSQVFRALQLTPLSSVRVVILGQDPYHDVGQAEGLCFSVPVGTAHPPSLRNILRELSDDLGIPVSPSGSLERWARQGVLLLNTVLTVRAHEANSHRRKGWEEVTSQILRAVNEQSRVAFLLWGAPAQEKAGLLDHRHMIHCSPHPSPLSAYRGFFGSRPFSRVNLWFEQNNLPAIDWTL